MSIMHRPSHSTLYGVLLCKKPGKIQEPCLLPIKLWMFVTHISLLKFVHAVHCQVCRSAFKVVLRCVQAKEQSALRQRAADLENLLLVTQTRNADLAAELAKAPRRQQLAAKGDADADPEQLACLQGNLAALAQCSLGQLYRSAVLCVQFHSSSPRKS